MDRGLEVWIDNKNLRMDRTANQCAKPIRLFHKKFLLTYRISVLSLIGVVSMNHCFELMRCSTPEETFKTAQNSISIKNMFNFIK